MADGKTNTTGIAAHGASRLPSVDIDSFNIELKDDEGSWETAPARVRSGKLSRSGASRCANLMTIPSESSFPRTSARRTWTPS